MSDSIDSTKLTIYNGLSAPEPFFKKFDIQALLNEWKSDSELINALGFFLSGKAKAAYELTQMNQTGTALTVYKEVKAAIIKACDLTTEQKLEIFSNRHPKSGESLRAYVQVLRDMIKSAMPEAKDTERECLVRAQILAHVPENIKQMIRLSSSMGTTTFDNYIQSLGEESIQPADASLETNAFQASRNYGNSYNYNNNNRGGRSGMNRNYQNYNRNYNNNINNNNNSNSGDKFKSSNYFNGDCYHCFENGHRAAQCPIKLQEIKDSRNIQSNRAQNSNQSSFNRNYNGQNRSNQRQNNNSNYDSNNYGTSNQNARDTSSNVTEASGGQNSNSWPWQENDYAEARDSKQYSCEIEEISSINTNVIETNVNTAKLLKNKVQIQFENCKTISSNALFDGGSDHCWISPNIISNECKQMVDKHKIKKIFNIRGVLSTKVAECDVINARLTIGDWSGVQEFIISDHVTKYETVIGRDFLKMSKSIINHGRDVLIIGNTVIPFVENIVNSINSDLIKLSKLEAKAKASEEASENTKPQINV